MIWDMMQALIKMMMKAMMLTRQVETIEKRQLRNIPEFSQYSRSHVYELYRAFLIESGLRPDAITRYTRLRIVDLCRITNLSEEHVRQHLEPLKRAS